MPLLRWFLRALRVIAGILAGPFGILATLGVVCVVVATVMVFVRDEPWSTAGIFAGVGVASGLLTWGLLAATTPGVRDVLSGLLDLVELVHTIGRGISVAFRGVGMVFRAFD